VCRKVFKNLENVAVSWKFRILLYDNYQNKEYHRSCETTEQRQEVKDMANLNVLLTMNGFRVSSLLGIIFF